MRRHVIGALSCYWPQGSGWIDKLPLLEPAVQPSLMMPLRLVPIVVPAWANACAVDGQLLVPQEALSEQALASAEPWRSVDWILAAFVLLEAWHERLWEQQHGPIHSYSLCLQGWDQRVWEHAWVNRIGLFLRIWATCHFNLSDNDIFGPLPRPRIYLTHDVDAVAKTLPIRLKQGAFNLFKTGRSLLRFDVESAWQHCAQALRFLFSKDQWNTFELLLTLEQQAGVQAVFHFFADVQPRGLRRWLLDPSYSIYSPTIRRLFTLLRQYNHSIGLHPGFDAWNDSSLLASSRQRLEWEAGVSVKHCRQHWLRFGWQKTWRAQSCAGLLQDFTLMFNDRPGFRASTALSWNPWDPILQNSYAIKATPTVFMDSHFYDYHPMSPEQRRALIERFLGECLAVHGEIAVLWHPHSLGRDYGWLSGFLVVLEILGANIK